MPCFGRTSLRTAYNEISSWFIGRSELLVRHFGEARQTYLGGNIESFNLARLRWARNAWVLGFW